MSLITCCPSCGTRFRVVPDQLKMADGWVRCGQCAEVFDAQMSLVTTPFADAAEAAADADDITTPQPEPQAMDPAAPGPLASESPTTDEPAPTPTPQAVPVDAIVMLDESPDESPDETAEAVPDAGAQPARIEPVLDFEIPDEDIAAPAAAGPQASPPEVHEADEAPAATEATVPDEAAAATLAQAAQDTDAASDQPPSDASDTPPDDAPTFVRQAYQRAFWRRPEMRVLLVLLALLLGLLMAAQVAVQQRDLLAAQMPALRPLLLALCKPLQCRVGPPQRIESIVIDGSSFTRLRPDAYRLSVTLSNQAGTPVAMPALELTLTDTQDQPVLRRVLQPADLGAEAPAVMAAHGEWSSTLTLALAANAATARIAGYRLLAFYP